jgi:WD domain, G-beta repeat
MTLHALLRERELSSASIYSRVHGAPTVARRLRLHGVLHGHAGCVNRLAFSRDATLLASASDDLTVRLWDAAVAGAAGPADRDGVFAADLDPAAWRENAAACRAEARADGWLRGTVQTGHTANIFGVRFMPGPDHAAVATGAMDCTVRVTPVSRPDPRDARVFEAHRGRVKTVDVHESDPAAILSAAEDGTVRRFDTRAPERDAAGVLVRLPRVGTDMDSVGVKSAAFSPDGAALVIASEAVRVYDVRALSSSRGGPAGPGEAVLTLLPAHLRGGVPERGTPLACGREVPFATHAAFSDCGTRVVASFHGDAVYTFDALRGAEDGRGSGEARAPETAQRMQRPRGGRDGQAALELRRRQLLGEAKREVRNGWNTAAIIKLNEAMQLVGGGGIVERLWRCEALLLRGWAADWRAALVDAEWMREAVAVKPQLLEVLAADASPPAVAAKDEVAKESQMRLWSAVMSAQRAAAVAGIILPHGRLVQGFDDADYRPDIRKMRSRLLRVRRMLTTTGIGVDQIVYSLVRLPDVLPARALDLLLPHVCDSYRCVVMRVIPRMTETARLCLDALHVLRATVSGQSAPRKRSVEARDSDLATFDGAMEQHIWFVDGDEDVFGYAETGELIVEMDGEDAAAWSELQTKGQSDNGASKSRKRPLEEEETRGAQVMSGFADASPYGFWGSLSVGYKQRFVGRLNLATDIKEANFYGADAQCVMSGSDDGCLYLWDASTGALLALLDADNDILNCCIQAPGAHGGGLVATSGIDSDVKLWRPRGEHDRSLSFAGFSAEVQSEEEEHLFCDHYDQESEAAFSHEVPREEFLMARLGLGELRMEDIFRAMLQGRAARSDEGAGEGMNDEMYEDVGEGADDGIDDDVGVDAADGSDGGE